MGVVTLLCCLMLIGIVASSQVTASQNPPLGHYAVPNVNNDIFTTFEEHREILSTFIMINELRMREFVLNHVDMFTKPLTLKPNVSEPCEMQLSALISGVETAELWALTVLDAFGKPTSGLLLGSTHWLGEYHECISVQVEEMNGRYCTLGNKFLETKPAKLQYGICMPDKCSNQDIVQVVNFGLIYVNNILKNFTNITLPEVQVGQLWCQDPHDWDTPAIVSMFVVGVLAGIAIIASLVDIHRRMKTFWKHFSLRNWSLLLRDDEEKDRLISDAIINNSEENNEAKIESIEPLKKNKESKWIKLLLSFSLYTNSIKLFTVGKVEGQLQCLHAIRAMSLAWVILGHIYFFGFGYVDNPTIAGPWFRRFSFSIISNAFFSVDTFFLMSGMLTCYLFLKEFNKTKKIKPGFIFKYYFHRLWRLIPPMMLVIMVSANLTKFVGSGPLFPAEGYEPNCRTYWWTNMLFINNVVHTDALCLDISWYLSNDMQFHWIAPIVLIPLALGQTRRVFKFFGFIVVAAIIVANVIVTALLLLKYPGSERGAVITDGGDTADYGKYIYITPWCRAGAYFVGIVFGYIMHICKDKKIRISSGWNLLFWIISLTTLGLMVFGTYPNFEGNFLSRTTNIIYQATSRIVWCVALSYIMFACLTGNGGFMNDILSWPIWTPLSRLSFSAYLFHTNVLHYYYLTQEHAMHFQDSTAIYNFLSSYIFSNVFAYLVSMLFEVPLLGLEKFFLH